MTTQSKKQAKWTPGKLKVSLGALVCEKINKYGNWIVAVCQREPTDEDEANLERLALCWNTHEQLLEACQQAAFAIPTTHAAFETVRAAIKAAGGEQ